MLVLDRDGSGMIDHADELSFAADLAGADSDLEGLRAYDSNGDGRLDSSDTEFNRFQLWQDTNQDGVSQAGELTNLSSRGITGLDLALTKTGERVTEATDNVIYATSSYQLADGSSGLVGDVFLGFVPAGLGEDIEFTGASEDVYAAEAPAPGGTDDDPVQIERPVIQGLDGDDELVGTPYNDLMEGAGGNDLITGGYGFDTAFYIGNKAEYAIETREGQIFVRGISGAGLTDGTDALSSIEQLVFADGAIGYAAPIVLDLNGNGVRLNELSGSNTRFDMTGRGVGEQSAWVSKGDAFLVLDRNGNGIVDGIDEMSFMDDKEDAKSDLDGLNTFDSNKSGAIDGADRRFSDFLLWRDVNGDGKSETSELSTLEQAGIVSVSLQGQAVNKKWKVGDSPILNNLTFTYADGRLGKGADVALAYSMSLLNPNASTLAPADPQQLRRNRGLSGLARRFEDFLTEADGDLGGRSPGQARALYAKDEDSGSANLNRLIEQMARFGGENDNAASADSMIWKKSLDPLHYGLLTASGITK
jgi:hypothetical protein